MTSDEDKARAFRQRAKELKTIAKGMADGKAKRTLIATSEEYEEMALRVDGNGTRPTKVSEENKRAWGKLGIKSGR